MQNEEVLLCFVLFFKNLSLLVFVGFKPTKVATIVLEDTFSWYRSLKDSQLSKIVDRFLSRQPRQHLLRPWSLAIMEDTSISALDKSCDMWPK